MATTIKKRKPLNRRARFPARQWEQKYSRALEPKLTAYSKRLVDKLQSAGVIDKFSAYLLAKYDNKPEEVRNAVRRDDFDPRADQSKLEAYARKTISDVTVNVESVVERFTKDIFTAGSKHAFGKLGVSAVWNVKAPEVLDAIKARVNLIQDATDFQAKRVLVAIRKEVYGNGGHPLDTSAISKIKDALPRISEERARTIARTETLAVQSQAAHTVYAENGIREKEWLYSGSGYERHMSLGGQVVGIDEAFTADTGEQLMYPGDENASPGESCNCMCTLMPVVSGFSIDPDEVNTGD